MVRALPSSCRRQPTQLDIKLNPFTPALDLNKQDMLFNAIDEHNILRKKSDGKPWRGPKQRTELFFKPLIYGMCPERGLVMDFAAATGK